MNIRDVNLPDTYDYQKHPPTPTEYNGILYRSQLEAIWATFFDKTVYAYCYEPQDNPFYGWLPDFAVQLRSADVQSVWCEVKPLHFKDFPHDIADKIKCAEPQRDNDLIVAILGLDAPVWLDNLPALGWISLRRRDGDRTWYPFSVGNHQAIAYRWGMAQTQIKTRGFKTVTESLVTAFDERREDSRKRKVWMDDLDDAFHWFAR